MTTARRQFSHAEPPTEPAVTPMDELLRRAVAAFFPEARAVAPAAGRPHLARVETAGGIWCVRRWPTGTTPERVRFVHELLREAQTAGIDFVPRVATLPEQQTSELALEGSLFDAQSWRPGRSLVRGAEIFDDRGNVINRPSPISTAGMRAAVHAIASFHTTTEAMAGRRGVPWLPLDAVLRAVRLTWEGERRRLRPIASRTPHIQRWIRTGEMVIAGAVESLAAAEFLRARPPVVGHLNLWPAHLLVARVEGQESITGLVDFAEAAASSPLVDLAQLIGHFNGWTGAAAEEALGAYVDVRPLSPEERRLLPAVAGLDLIAETGRLLTLGYATPAIAATAAVTSLRASAATMLSSLEAVAAAVQRGDRPEPSKARKWTYRPRPAVGKGEDRTPSRKGSRAPRDRSPKGENR
jgi:hypothetical protein